MAQTTTSMLERLPSVEEVAKKLAENMKERRTLRQLMKVAKSATGKRKGEPDAK